MRLQLFFITILMIAVTKPPTLITSIDWYLGALVCFAVSIGMRMALLNALSADINNIKLAMEELK